MKRGKNWVSEAILAKLTCVVDEKNKKFGRDDARRGHWKEVEFIRKSLAVLNTETGGVRSDSARRSRNQLKQAIRLMCKINSNEVTLIFIFFCRPVLHGNVEANGWILFPAGS